MPSMSAALRAISTSKPYQLAVRKAVLPWVLQGAHTEGELLEIGTGSGAMTAQLLAAQPKLRVVSTDFDPRMVAVAQESLAPFGDRVTAQQADATALPFEDSRFDVVLSCGMLHHVGDWRKALAEAVRVLSPGGRLIGYDIIATPAVRRLHLGTATMIEPGQLENELRGLPLTDVRTRRTLGGSTVRFTVTKSAA